MVAKNGVSTTLQNTPTAQAIIPFFGSPSRPSLTRASKSLWERISAYYASFLVSKMDRPIETSFLVISDTHGEHLQLLPTGKFDVLIHCGDLTDESKLKEYHTTIDLMRVFDAPLKLVIAGNHDFSLDAPVLQKKLAHLRDDAEIAPIIKREYGDYGEARALFESPEAKAAGIVFLDEGTHQFTLANGALLRVYASPYTPSVNEWAFDFDPAKGHKWAIPADIDIVITHNPPKGVLDMTAERTRAGDGDLFAAVARARPLMHCFGHIHPAWGARKVAWRKTPSETPSHFADIDNEKSKTLANLAMLRRNEPEPETEHDASSVAFEAAVRGECRCTSYFPPRKGEQTVFVNAAIQGEKGWDQHLPWLVRLNLARAER